MTVEPPGPAGGAGRVHRRSAGTRALAAGCAILFAAGAVSFWAASGPTAGALVSAALALLALANLVTALADRYTLGEDGIEYRNDLLCRLGRRPRRVAWSEIVAVREHHRLRAGRPELRPSAVFLTLRSGRRLVLDSLEDYDEVLRAVRRHIPQ
jgi:hypothetical protein